MSRKIYFCGSIRAGRDDAELYAKIIDSLKTYGAVLTEHVGNDAQLTKAMEEMDDAEIHTLDMDMLQSCDEKDITEKEIHDRDVDWLKDSDVVVAEVTQPSLGVGYEIGRAVAMEKPILCLFRPESGKRLSAMIDGAHNGDSFVVKRYEVKEYPDILKQYFAKCDKSAIDS